MDENTERAPWQFTEETAAQYEADQGRNPLFRWLHSLRYKHITEVFESIHLDRPIRVVEIGCAQSKLFGLLNKRFSIQYTGIDIDPMLISIASRRYAKSENFSARVGRAEEVLPTLEQPDIVVALETLEHVGAPIAQGIVDAIAKLKPSLFVCSVPVEVGPIIWVKNAGSALLRYSRHHEYTWAETLWSGLYQLDRVRPNDGGHRGFDWRVLAAAIRDNMDLREVRRFPFGLPAGLSTSVFMVARTI